MIVGSFGEVVFEVSRFKVRTFDDFKRAGSGRWASHEVINKKQVLEFLGPSTESISFTMQLNAMLGVSPQVELKRLRNMRDAGRSYPLVLADSMVGDNNWVLKSADESVSKFDGRGNIISVSVAVALEEYAPSYVATGGSK